MEFVDGVVIAVPEANREAYRTAAQGLADMFLDCGAIEVVDCWGSDVPEGNLTSFPLAVQRQTGEAVVFSWVKWPSRTVREAGWKIAMNHPRMQASYPTLFDGKRMIFGGFDVIQSKRTGD
ncbi:MAG: DUF1428 domain-containing protein [Cypionkella sp.]